MSADAAIVQAATWTAIAAGGYLAVGTLAARVRTHPRAATAAVGLGLAAGLAGGGVAVAASDEARHPRPPAVSVDWPAASPGPEPTVVVRTGDCLWTIAAGLLDRPTPTRVAATWPRWWRTNRRVVGSDPSLIRPGQRLRPPVPLRSQS